MESVNAATSGNTVALHTTDDCSMADVQRQMVGTAGQGDCHNETNFNTGCTVTGPASTYGPDFNKAGGGVVALEWREEGIRVWVFGRDGGGDGGRGVGSLPVAAVPDPSVWGRPLADFPATNCDVGSHFKNQSIVVNIDLCGYLTEAVWESSGCEWLPLNCLVEEITDTEQALQLARIMLPIIPRLLRMRFGSLGHSRFSRHGKRKERNRRVGCLIVVVFTYKSNCNTRVLLSSTFIHLCSNPLLLPLFELGVHTYHFQPPPIRIVRKLSGVLRAVSDICQITSIHPSIPLGIPCPKVYASKTPNASAMDNTTKTRLLSVQHPS